MAIPDEIIEQVRNAVDIVELVRESVPNLKRAGRNWKANCPFHNEKSPSFMVSPDKGIFHCFGCQKGGDSFRFVMEMENLTWPEAVRKLAGRAGITIRESKDDSYKSSERQKLFDLLESAAQFYHRCLNESADAVAARQYLAKRGFMGETQEKFCIGYAPGKLLIAAAAKKGFSTEQLAAAGLVTHTERGNIFEYMAGRVVFPIYSAQGRVVAFGGRTLDPEGQPKYLNSPETAVYSKSEHLYGLFQAMNTVRKSREIVVLEGYMDVSLTHQMGATNTVATLGTSLTAQHAKMLNRHADKVTLLFDSDAAGFNAARRAIETLVETELMVSVASLPDGLDPDEYILKYGREQFLAYIAGNSKSSQEFICDHIIEKQGSVSAEQKARVAAEIIPLLSRIKNSIVRREWIRRLAEKIGSTEDAVVAEWQKFSKKGLARDSKIMRQAPTDAGAAANLDANAGIHRTVEEQLLQLLAAHPELAVAVNESVFENGRCLSVFRQLTKGETASEILAEMNDADMSWFRPLIMEERKYPYPQQIVNTLLRDINSRRLRAEFEKLEPQYLHMAAGETAKDETVINRYKQLLCLLKGSGKP